MGAEFRHEKFGEPADRRHVLADLRALEKVSAVQAGAEHEMAFEQGARAFEDGEDFLLLRIHGGEYAGCGREKNKNFFATPPHPGHPRHVVIEYAPLEDELGDVLEKAMRHRGLSEQALAERAGVALEKIRDAIDYRHEFSSHEVSRLAQALGLNEAGLHALLAGRYPLPAISGLPFCLHPLRMTHGIGVANAYIIAECGGKRGLLFDTGSDYAQLRQVWPKTVQALDAVFVTHAETEHTGGLAGIRQAFPQTPSFGPPGQQAAGANLTALGDQATLTFGGFEVRVLTTPGHAEAHNCYLVRVPKLPEAASLLISGDLIFAGSVGGAYHCQSRLMESLRRLVRELPDAAVIAPGHGPLTTLQNERSFNPFMS
jgi:hydroxyacylglutathione hydrolase